MLQTHGMADLGSGESVHTPHSITTARKDRTMSTRKPARISPYGSVDNIIRFYDRATPDDIAQGIAWYRDANAFAHTLAEHGRITIDQACDIIAANSINTPWDRNVILAWHHVVNGHTVYSGTTRVITHMVDRILSGERLHDIVGRDSRKVRSFSCNIGGDLDVATIDRWAYRIWTGLQECECTKHRKDGTLKHGCGHVPNGAEYEACANDYMIAASRLGLNVAVLQAITWIVLRGSAS